MRNDRAGGDVQIAGEPGITAGDAPLGLRHQRFALLCHTQQCIARFGRHSMAAAGLVLIAASAAVALAGTTVAHFWTALILLGIGWNFGYVSATAMVASLYRPEESFRVQAFSEFALFGTVAAASFSSGRVLALAGWDVLNWIVLPVVGAMLVLLAVQGLSERRGAARSDPLRNSPEEQHINGLDPT